MILKLPPVFFCINRTTGNPKDCLQTNTSLLNHSYQVGEYFEVTQDHDTLTNAYDEATVAGTAALVAHYVATDRSISALAIEPEGQPVDWCLR